MIAYCGVKFFKPPEKFLGSLPKSWKKIFSVLIFILAFIFLTAVLYGPFIKWYGQGYNAVEIWKGDKTPIFSFLIHWGFFIFIIFSWLSIEIYKWMATTPLSALRPYYPYRKHFGFLFAMILLTIAAGFAWGVKTVIISLPLIILLGILIIRKDYSDLKRFVVFILIAGLMLTLIVENVVISGDIGRMNTVFKFYMQAWTLLALGSAYILQRVLKRLSSTTSDNLIKENLEFSICFIDSLCFAFSCNCKRG